MKILVIEDHIPLQEAIVDAIKVENIICEIASNFKESEDKIVSFEYDVIVVDINLPGGSGLELIKLIKKMTPKSGIIVISARNSLDNKLEGLMLGADDYLTKPFDMAELIARIKAIIRRRNFDGNSRIDIGEITIFVDQRKVKIRDVPIDLTKSEFEILLYFTSNVGIVLTKESIAEHIWGDNMDLADSFDFIYSHIKNLRKKITSIIPSDPIKAVYGIGYKFEQV